MIAVEDRELVDEEKLAALKEEIREYEAPEAKVGHPVLYYWQATANSRKPCLAWVTGIFGCLVDLYILADIGGPQHREAVRHMSDPKLKMNSEQRENGGWDYTPFEKKRMEEQEELDKRLRTLELALIAPVKCDREVLRLQAKKLEIKGAHKMNSDDLREKIIAELKSRGEQVVEQAEDTSESAE